MSDQTSREHALKSILPPAAWRLARSLGTAVLTPLDFSYRTGHLRSSFSNKAVTADGAALPWYTYPCIDFLAQRPYAGRTVLEFGAGQSSLWWAAHAKAVTSLEGDAGWHDHIKSKMPGNVDLHLIHGEERDRCIAEARQVLDGRGKFDLVIIDGLWRRELVAVALDHVADGGAIIFDNADGYGLQEETKDGKLSRVDFFGYAPGVSKPSCTSIFFGPDCFLFSPAHPIPVIGQTR